MVALGEGQGNISANYRAKGPAFGEQAHIQMNHEKANRKERRRRVDQDGCAERGVNVMENIAETTGRRHSRAEASSSRRTPKRETFGPHCIGQRVAFCRLGWCCSSARLSTRLCLHLFRAFAEPTSRTCRRPRL